MKMNRQLVSWTEQGSYSRHCNHAINDVKMSTAGARRAGRLVAVNPWCVCVQRQNPRGNCPVTYAHYSSLLLAFRFRLTWRWLLVLSDQRFGCF